MISEIRLVHQGIDGVVPMMRGVKGPYSVVRRHEQARLLPFGWISPKYRWRGTKGLQRNIESVRNYARATVEGIGMLQHSSRRYWFSLEAAPFVENSEEIVFVNHGQRFGLGVHP